MLGKTHKFSAGALKLDLMMRGVRLDDSFAQKYRVLGDFRLGPKNFGNLELILPEGLGVSVPYQEDFIQSSPYKLRSVNKKVFLTGRGGSLPVKWVPQPDYYGQVVNAKVKLGEVACVHGGYVSLALGGHRYLKPTLVGEKGETHRPELVLSVDETVAVIERIRKERAIDVISLSCWQPGEDGGVSQVEPYVRAIKKYFKVLVFVEIHLPRHAGTIDETYAMGADSVCYHIGNLCSHGDGAGTAPSEKDFEVRLLRHAVDVYPQGTILAHITLGRGSIAESEADIAELSALKVLPILTLESLAIAHERGLTAVELAPLFGFLYNAAKKHGIKMNWFARLSPFLTPIEGRFFAGDMPRFKLALLNFYQSRVLGGSVSAALSNLRRKLRVKVIDKDENES